jgi:hypothetical protein
VGEIMSVKIKFPDQPMTDGTIPELWIVPAEGAATFGGTAIKDHLETSRWLSSINSPLSLGQVELILYGQLPNAEQTTEILEAMANLMVVVSRVGYEMAAAKHEGGEG